MSLLNRGLTFVLPPTNPPIEDLCVDIMSSVRYKPRECRDEVEDNALRHMREIVESNTPTKNKRAIKLQKFEREENDVYESR